MRAPEKHDGYQAFVSSQSNTRTKAIPPLLARAGRTRRAGNFESILQRLQVRENGETSKNEPEVDALSAC